MHYLCDNCQYPMRMSVTRRGFYVFSNQGAYRYRPITWDDVMSKVPFKMSDKLAAWFKNNYYPPKRK